MNTQSLNTYSRTLKTAEGVSLLLQIIQSQSSGLIFSVSLLVDTAMYTLPWFVVTYPNLNL